ncbi:MAG: thioredoxin domain-containing protein [Verrucomicrobia bacterium]|nr:thioredoxin domain-containing protein [Verrucomicrobiota bacterium]
MRLQFTFRQILVLGTAAFAMVTAGAGATILAFSLPEAVHIETAGCPCVGKKEAPVEIVLFEDFRCSTCRTFNETVLPEIETKFISSGRAKFTLIPLAFLRGSKPMANAALAVYQMAPDRFLPYVHTLFQAHAPLDQQGLLEAAQRVGGIDLVKLEACLASHCHYAELDRNMEIAKEVMGKDLGTPALYVNGVSTSTSSFEAVRSVVDKVAPKGQK